MSKAYDMCDHGIARDGEMAKYTDISYTMKTDTK